MSDLQKPKVVFKRENLRLRTTTGQYINGTYQVYEVHRPFALIIFIHLSGTKHARADISSEALAEELRRWLDGVTLNHPAYLTVPRTEEMMNRYIKFAKPPQQEDLALWILSRCELSLSDSLNGNQPSLYFGKQSKYVDDGVLDMELDQTQLKESKIGYNTFEMSAEEQESKFVLDESNTNVKIPNRIGPTTAFAGRSKQKVQLHTFDLTQQILGNSEALNELSKSTIKVRPDAKSTFNKDEWTADHHRLVAFIERGRNAVESAMEERRKMLAVSKTRQKQAFEKYRKIRYDIEGGAAAGKWVKKANEEMISLHRIEGDVRDDLKRQKNRAHRAKQHVIWTLAPADDAKLRGKSIPGPLLGPGPLPSEATTNYLDPRIEKAVALNRWDIHGRRKRQDPEAIEPPSQVEVALEAIKKAAASASLYKLDLKAVFGAMDTDGSGYLEFDEFSEAITSLGAKLTLIQMDAVFRHFDPNDSGSVNYGEFMWAFFNRRSLARRWGRNTKDMSKKELKDTFESCDLNGDGKLDDREFKKLLDKFNITLSDTDRELLMNQFDSDGDSRIDWNEFMNFIEAEQKKLRKSAEEARLDQKKEVEELKARPSTAPNRLNATAPAYLQKDAVLAQQKQMSSTSTGAVSSPIKAKAAAAKNKGKDFNNTMNSTTNKRNKTTKPDDETLVHGLEALGTLNLSGTNVTKAADYARGLKESGETNENVGTKYQYDARNVLVSQWEEEVAAGHDPLWMAKVLQIQSAIEEKLGGEYSQYFNSQNSNLQRGTHQFKVSNGSVMVGTK